jgi:hypothetical protein
LDLGALDSKLAHNLVFVQHPLVLVNLLVLDDGTHDVLDAEMVACLNVDVLHIFIFWQHKSAVASLQEKNGENFVTLEVQVLINLEVVRL